MNDGVSLINFQKCDNKSGKEFTFGLIKLKLNFRPETVELYI